MGWKRIGLMRRLAAGGEARERASFLQGRDLMRENGLRVFTSEKSDSYDTIRIFRKEKSLLMDCSNHQQNACTSRPQISPCMSAGCGCGGKPIRPTNPIQPVTPNQGQGIKPCQDGCNKLRRCFLKNKLNNPQGVNPFMAKNPIQRQKAFTNDS